MKPEHTRPFDLDHAKAGAPFCGGSGEAVRVLIWDRKHPTHPIIVIEEDGDQEAVAFQSDGKTHFQTGYTVTELVMIPLGYIDGKPVFVGDQVVTPAGYAWTATPTCRANSTMADCYWPAPAPVYPTTLLLNSEMVDIYVKHLREECGYLEISVESTGLTKVANAALRCAIDAGQVVVPGEAVAGLRPFNPYTGHRRDQRDIDSDPMGLMVRHKDEPVRSDKHFYGDVHGFYVEGNKASIAFVKKMLDGRAARDMAIAEAVRDACLANKGNLDLLACGLLGIDLATIIATVK